ncbi:VOC family protein [Caproicibacter sp.]|uniref:VOC family protein n=1 Tax=Caproicibacter sp. TaxID=2814884 RepID=UPI0039898840
MSLSFHLSSLYVCVKDMERAIRFYETLLGQKVTKKDPVYSVFGIDGFRYGLFAHEKRMEPHQWGNSCLPSLAVNRMDSALQRLEELNSEIVFPLTVIGNNQVLEFLDSEGNQVELTCSLK